MILEQTVIRRPIHGFHVDGQTIRLNAYAVDSPGDGGACYQYLVTREDADSQMGFLNFHQGLVGDDEKNWTNGLTNEVVLAIVADRLKGFQEGPLACKENSVALKKIEEALEVLLNRTRKRIDRQVENTLNP